MSSCSCRDLVIYGETNFDLKVFTLQYCFVLRGRWSACLVAIAAAVYAIRGQGVAARSTHRGRTQPRRTRAEQEDAPGRGARAGARRAPRGDYDSTTVGCSNSLGWCLALGHD